MGKAAAHFIQCNHQTYRLHYLQWDHTGCLTGIYPLEEEIAALPFYNGTLIVVAPNTPFDLAMTIENGRDYSVGLTIGNPIKIFHLDRGKNREIPLF